MTPIHTVQSVEEEVCAEAVAAALPAASAEMAALRLTVTGTTTELFAGSVPTSFVRAVKAKSALSCGIRQLRFRRDQSMIGQCDVDLSPDPAAKSVAYQVPRWSRLEPARWSGTSSAR